MRSQLLKIIAVLIVISPLSFAKQTHYLSFEEPPGWNCELSQGVYICQSPTDPDKRESLILSIATVATEWDTLDNYENYLKQPKSITDDAGKTIQSKITYVRRRNINGHDWIDSLQQNSELPGFWTRYVATVQKPLAILITYVVSEERYTILAPQFERMVASLKPITDIKLTNENNEVLPPGNELGNVIKNQLQKRQLVAKAPVVEPPKEERGLPIPQIGLLVVLLLAMVVLIQRSKKK